MRTPRSCHLRTLLTTTNVCQWKLSQSPVVEKFQCKRKTKVCSSPPRTTSERIVWCSIAYTYRVLFGYRGRTAKSGWAIFIISEGIYILLYRKLLIPDNVTRQRNNSGAKTIFFCHNNRIVLDAIEKTFTRAPKTTFIGRLAICRGASWLMTRWRTLYFRSFNRGVKTTVLLQ